MKSRTPIRSIKKLKKTEGFSEIALSENKLREMKAWFDQYCKSFTSFSEKQKANFQLKYTHTYEVAKIIVEMGKRLGLKPPQLAIAELIGLFHDLGRFEQIKRYNTFSDAKSMDHGDFGMQVIKEFKLLDKIEEMNQRSKETVLKAVKYHNKLELPDLEDQTTLFYIQLIRDADKIDIYRVLLEYYNDASDEKDQTVVLNLKSEEKLSESVIEKIKQGKIVEKRQIKNVNDFKLLNLSWIFDFNFYASLQLLKEKGYYEQMCGMLPNTEQAKGVIDILMSAFSELLGEDVQ